MCSLDSRDILTYMGDGIWDLRPAKEIKLTDEEKKTLSKTNLEKEEAWL